MTIQTLAKRHENVNVVRCVQDARFQLIGQPLSWEPSAQQRHSRFHAMHFQFFGNKGIVQLCLRFDLCHRNAKAGIFIRFLKEYEAQLDSPQHREAQNKSETKAKLRDKEETELSQQIYEMRCQVREGRDLQDSIDAGTTVLQDLTEDKKALVDKYIDSGIWDKDPDTGEDVFVSSLERQLKDLEEQLRRPAALSAVEEKKYSAGSIAITQMEKLESGDSLRTNSYRPEARMFNFSGRTEHPFYRSKRKRWYSDWSAQ